MLEVDYMLFYKNYNNYSLRWNYLKCDFSF